MTGYVVKLFRHEPETRWLHRVVLRRKTRARLIHSGIPESFVLERNINNVSNCVFVLRDPMESLTWTEAIP